MKYSNFDVYRRWFNQMFSLSFDGKFKGLSTLVRLYGEKFVEHLAYRLYKLLNCSRRHAPVGDIIVIRLSGHVIKLYNR